MAAVAGLYLNTGAAGSDLVREWPVQGLCDDRVVCGLCGGACTVGQSDGDTSKSVLHICLRAAQAAAVAALTGPQGNVAMFRRAFQRRRDLVIAAVSQITGLTLPPPEGAFYACIGCEALIRRRSSAVLLLATDIDVAKFLLAEAGVAMVPGSAYALSPFIRQSTATSDDRLRDAMDRIGKAVAKL